MMMDENANITNTATVSDDSASERVRREIVQQILRGLDLMLEARMGIMEVEVRGDEIFVRPQPSYKFKIVENTAA